MLCDRFNTTRKYEPSFALDTGARGSCFIFIQPGLLRSEMHMTLKRKKDGLEQCGREMKGKLSEHGNEGAQVIATKKQRRKHAGKSYRRFFIEDMESATLQGSRWEGKAAASLQQIEILTFGVQNLLIAKIP
jgi:hypothetical protein